MSVLLEEAVNQKKIKSESVCVCVWGGGGGGGKRVWVTHISQKFHPVEKSQRLVTCHNI